MVICHCKAVNDVAIRNAVLAGAREPEHLAERCGAGTRCGGCMPALQALLDELDRGSLVDVRSSAA
jgi:bacterioferritin-associated ferredoxin